MSFLLKIFNFYNLRKICLLHGHVFVMNMSFVTKIALEFTDVLEKLLLKSENLPLIMVFRRKFSYGGRQKNYFPVKILILVCPNRTCKNFENR